MGVETIVTCDSCGQVLGQQRTMNRWFTVDVTIENEVESAIVGSPMRFRAIWCASCVEEKLGAMTQLMKVKNG